MSKRHEWTGADAPVRLVPPGISLGSGGDDRTDAWALVLGNEYATALVVQGTPSELAAFVMRATDVLLGAAGEPVDHEAASAAFKMGG
jgi:hypothetical protein